MPGVLQIHTLGGLEIKIEGESIPALASRKGDALLVYLAYTLRAHTRESLAAMLWDDSPQERATGNLKVILTSMRKHLKPYLTITRQTVAFNPETPHWLDAAELEKKLAPLLDQQQARTLTKGQAQLFEQALLFYKGAFLEGYYLPNCREFEAWAALEREHLDRLIFEASRSLVRFYLQTGDYPAGIRHAAQLLKIDPYQEDTHRQMMLLLARNGQRNAALQQYQTCRQILREELGVEPVETTTALYERIREAGPPRQNLPTPATPFVGRRKNLALILERLSDPTCRLLTLVGIGGTGKTRLALKAASAKTNAFLHGVYYVPLEPLSSPKLIIPTIASAIGFSFFSQVDPQKQLLSHLKGKEILLVLDNFEHLLEGASILEAILEAAPEVKILVTSRERLNLRAEWLVEINGMQVPPLAGKKEKEGDMVEIENYEAVELFIQRAQQVQVDFSLNSEIALKVARICQICEGLPLAIEMAATWVRTLPVPEIADAITQGFDFLQSPLRGSPDRHHSLRAVFDHSWKLLDPQERATFRRLAVFQGGFQLEAAREVSATSIQTLTALVDKSLLQRDGGRYQMHALLHQYAVEKLDADPEEAARVREKHGRYYASLLWRLAPKLRGPDQKEALAAIDEELENIRQTWHTALERQDFSQIDRCIPGLYRYFRIRSRFQEGITLFDEATSKLPKDDPHRDIYARALSRQGALQQHTGDYPLASEQLRQSLAIFQALEARDEQTFCLITLADLARRRGAYEQTIELGQQGLILAHETGSRWGLASTYFLVGNANSILGNLGLASKYLKKSLAIAQKQGDQRMILTALNGLGDLACYEGAYRQAENIFQQCLDISRELGDRYRESVQRNNLGTVFHVLKQHERAQVMYQESLDICLRIGDLEGRAYVLGNLGEIKHELGDDSGAMRYFQQALSLAREIQHPWMMAINLNNLGQTATALGDTISARTYLIEALEHTQTLRTIPLLLHVLVNLGGLFAQTGERQRAMELFSSAIHHPSCEQFVREKAERLLHRLNGSTPIKPTRNVEAIAEKLLVDLAVCA